MIYDLLLVVRYVLLVVSRPVFNRYGLCFVCVLFIVCCLLVVV